MGLACFNYAAGHSVGATLAANVALVLRDTDFQPPPKLLVLVNGLFQAQSLNTPSYRYNQHNAFQTKRMAAWFLGNYVFASQRHYNDFYDCAPPLAPSSDAQLSGARGTDVIMSTDWLPRDEILEEFDDADSFEAVPDFQQQRLREFRAQIATAVSNGRLNAAHTDESRVDLVRDLDAFPLTTDDLSSLPKTFIYTCQYDVLRDDGLFLAHRLRDAGNDVSAVNLRECHHLWPVLPGEQFRHLFELMFYLIAQEL